jgi:hypothetical protein
MLGLVAFNVYDMHDEKTDKDPLIEGITKQYNKVVPYHKHKYSLLNILKI